MSKRSKSECRGEGLVRQKFSFPGDSRFDNTLRYGQIHIPDSGLMEFRRLHQELVERAEKLEADYLKSIDRGDFDEVPIKSTKAEEPKSEFARKLRNGTLFDGPDKKDVSQNSENHVLGEKFFDSLNGRDFAEKDLDMIRSLRAMISKSPQKIVDHLADRPADIIAAFDDLKIDCPNFTEAIDFLKAEALIAISNPAASIAPLILAGPPGVGKTHFAEKVAEKLGFVSRFINLGAADGSMEICGSNSQWSSAKPSALLKLVAENNTKNFVIFFDELGAKSFDDRFPIEPALLSIFDENESKRFRCNFFEHQFDVSRSIKIAATNYPERISEPLRDRSCLVDIKPPSPEHFRGIVMKMAGEFTCGATADAIDMLARTQLPLRELRRQIKSLAAKAITAQRPINSDDALSLYLAGKVQITCESSEKFH